MEGDEIGSGGELDEKAGERATQLKVEVELGADEQDVHVEVVGVEFGNGVGGSVESAC